MFDTDELDSFREGLGFLSLGIEKVLDAQNREISAAKELDPVIRKLAKELENYANLGQLVDVDITKIALLKQCRKVFRLRSLARKSFYQFRSIKEALEAIFYADFRAYIYGDGPAPSIEATLNFDFRQLEDDDPKARKSDRPEQIFRHDKFTTTAVEALAETIGEISKGLTFAMATSDWQTSRELQDKYLVAARKALALCQIVLPWCEEFGSKYSDLFDKFFRSMLNFMGRSMLAIARLTVDLQVVIGKRTA